MTIDASQPQPILAIEQCQTNKQGKILLNEDRSDIAKQTFWFQGGTVQIEGAIMELRQ